MSRTYLRNWHIVGQPGQFTHMQLWNGGTKQIRVKQLLLTSLIDTSCGLLYCSTPLAHGIVDESSSGNGAGANGGLTSDGSLSTAGELRWVVDGEQLGGQLLSCWLQPRQTFAVSALDGWIIIPGRGLLVRLGTAGIGLYGSFKWVE